MTGSSNRLSALQRDLLGAFFARTQAFFLTGGGALAAFHLRHRTTKDLDLFAPSEVEIDDGARAIVAAAQAVGAQAQIERSSGDFRRFAVRRGSELTLVDLVIDRVPQIVPEKVAFGLVRVDPIREIAANKICALLARAEARDLFDLKVMLDGGLRLEEVLEDAQRKDAGADAATLAWVLSDARVGDLSPVPPEATAEDLEGFRQDLVRRLSKMALPQDPG